MVSDPGHPFENVLQVPDNRCNFPDVVKTTTVIKIRQQHICDSVVVV